MKRQIPNPAFHRLIWSAGIISAFLILCDGVQAQYVVSAKAGIVQFAVGEVSLDGKPLHLSQGDYVQMEDGQSLHTRRGRAEVLLSANVYLRLGVEGLLKMHQNRLDDTQLALEQGSALIEVVEKTKENHIRIKFAGGVVEIRKQGLYRFDAATHELRVYGGEARVTKKKLKAKVKKGKMICLDGDRKASKFDTKAVDSLHKWAGLRSFTLFAGTPSHRTQQHWVPLSLGWLKNYNYGMSIQSPELYSWQWRAQDRMSFMAGIAAAAVQRAEQEAAAQAMREAAMKRAMQTNPQP